MVTALVPFPYIIQPVANIAPFTYADGATYLTILQTMQDWLNKTLVPAVNDAYADALAQAQNGVGNAEATVAAAKLDWDTRYDALMADLSAQIAVLNDGTVAGMVTNASSTTGAALRTLIGSSIDGRLTADTVIAFISGTYYNKTQADALFATKNDLTAGLATGAANLAAGLAATKTDAVNTAATARENTIISGATLTVYGHSYAVVPGAYTSPGGDWPTKLVSALNLKGVYRAQSGARMADMAFAAIGNNFVGPGGDRHYPAGKNGGVVIECETNDALFGSGSAAYLRGFTHALRALLATVTAGQRIESTAAVTTGPWSTFTYGVASAGSALYCSADGNTLTWNNVTAPAGVAYVLTYANDNAVSKTGSLAVAVNGTTQVASYVGQDQMEAYTTLMDGTLNFSYSPAVIKITLPSEGAHTVTITTSGTGGDPSKQCWVDALLIPPAVSIPVVVCKDPPPGPAATTAVQTAWATNSPSLHTIISSVAAEFPSAKVVDLANGWNPATMVASTDGGHFHPGDAGMDQIVTNLKEPVRTALVSHVTKKFWG